MATHKYQIIPISVRRSITWRIPIDLLDAIDKVRKKDGRDRTAVVVEALQGYLRAAVTRDVKSWRGRAR